MLKRTPLALLLALCVFAAPSAQVTYIAPQTSSWPNPYAVFLLYPVKSSGAELSGTGSFAGQACSDTPDALMTSVKEGCDQSWVHLHEGHTGEDAADVFAAVYNGFSQRLTTTDHKIDCQYYMHGVAVSGWVTDCDEFEFTNADADLASMESGIHDIQVDVRLQAGINAGAMSTTIASVSSSTVFTVANAGTAAVGDAIVILPAICATTRGAHAKYITAKTGNQITINSALTGGCASIANGDVVRLATRDDYRPVHIFAHANWTGRTQSTDCPIIPSGEEYITYDDVISARTSIEYVDCAAAEAAVLTPTKTYTVDSTTDPSWTAIPSSEHSGGADLYQELLMPHTELFQGIQMLWEEPTTSPDAGLPFFRMMAPKFDEFHMYPHLPVTWFHQRFPFKDGPLGTCWISPYIQGQAMANGDVAFVEPGGRAGILKPDGSCYTFAGYRVKDGELPVWMSKPLARVQDSFDHVGTWSTGPSTFKQPLDISQDPQNPTHFYIVDQGNNLIWKAVTSGTGYSATATMTVFAGSTAGTAGYTNATGTAARFDGPTSLVWDLTGTYLYVADQRNDAYRRIDRSGVVTTLLGQGTSEGTREAAILTAKCAATTYSPDGFSPAPSTNRTCSQYEGTAPDAFFPHTVRVFSDGDLMLFDAGFGGAIREYDIATDTANEIHLAGCGRFITSTNFVWQWADVDRWGKSGPTDGIYFGGFQCSSIGTLAEGAATRTNESYGWTPRGGGGAYWIFGPDINANPDGFGSYYYSDPPHYFWIMIVRSQGGVLLAGSGEHGITLLRKKFSGDVDPPPLSIDFFNGKWGWSSPGYLGYEGVPSFALKYGHAGNFTQYASLWDVEDDTTDEEIQTMFNIPDALWDDATTHAQLETYIRANRGPVMTQGEAPETPTTRRRLRFRIAEWLDWLFKPAAVTASRRLIHQHAR